MSWTCQRQTKGVRCRKVNRGTARKCERCGKPKPPKRQPAHRRALELTYEQYVELNGGEERCGICGTGPGSRRLDRDHDHKTGLPRGLLCSRCNRWLTVWMTGPWLMAAHEYLIRHQLRNLSPEDSP